MPIQNKWFPESAFQSASAGKSIVALQTQTNALTHLRAVLNDSYCVRVLIGPERSGKSTIVQQFTAGLQNNVAIAVLDGSGMTADELLTEALVQFGYRMELEAADDLLRMINIFVLQQARANQAPLLIVENIEKMTPAALRALCLIASFTQQGQFATRIVLTGSRRALPMLYSKGMATLSKRIESVFDVPPLTHNEATSYLQGRLVASGITHADTVLPMNVCDKIYDLTNGLPGELNDVALRTLEQSLTFPATEVDIDSQEKMRKMEHSTPRLVLSLNGKSVQEFDFKEKKVTIGRSSLADIVINNEYASKFHVLLIRNSDALILVDLNSANGTFVNSVKVQSTLLKSNDIVSLANYRIKVLNAPEPDAPREAPLLQDTAKMKTLDDMRELQNTQLRRQDTWHKFSS